MSKQPALFSFLAAVAVLSAQPALACPLTHSTISYTVSSGDSLWSIASRFGTSVAALERRNALSDSSTLSLGEPIVVGDRYAPSHNCARHAGHARAAAARAAARRSRAYAVQSAAFAPIVGRQALWAATHVGSLPIYGLTTIAVAQAQRAFALDAKITSTALRFLGVPYSWGGTSFGGVDCSGFVWAVFARNGMDLPRTADAQFEEGHHVRVSDLRPGDLVFFQTYAPGASHVGIYLGGGKFVHASSSDGVRIDQLAEDYYAERFIGARRLTGV